MSHRKIEWLNDRRIIYRKDPVNDVPTISTKHYNYYEDGTYEHYHLFNSRSKITTYKSLKWHMLVLKYLNDDLLDLEFASICHFLADKENGFVTFFIKDKLLHEMIKDVINQGGDPPINRKRRIVFKDYNLLSFEEKMKIVGQLIGRTKLDKEDIYQCMLDLAHINKKITIQLLAELLGCSTRTIYRNMTKELRKEKTILNEKI